MKSLGCKFSFAPNTANLRKGLLSKHLSRKILLPDAAFHLCLSEGFRLRNSLLSAFVLGIYLLGPLFRVFVFGHAPARLVGARCGRWTSGDRWGRRGRWARWGAWGSWGQ